MKIKEFKLKQKKDGNYKATLKGSVSIVDNKGNLCFDHSILIKVPSIVKNRVQEMFSTLEAIEKAERNNFN